MIQWMLVHRYKTDLKSADTSASFASFSFACGLRFFFGASDVVDAAANAAAGLQKDHQCQQNTHIGCQNIQLRAADLGKFVRGHPMPIVPIMCTC